MTISLLVFGISNDIENPDVPFESCIIGVDDPPTLEDLSNWVRQHIYPLVPSPAIRYFQISGKIVWILRVARGLVGPYSYYNSETGGFHFYKKTSGTLSKVRPHELREIFFEALLEQSQRIVSASRTNTTPPERSQAFLQKHLPQTRKFLQEPDLYGHIALISEPEPELNLDLSRAERFIRANCQKFAEYLRYVGDPSPFQTGFRLVYPPPSERSPTGVSCLTVYRNGVICFDSLADVQKTGERSINGYWLAYQVQRHLQLSKALLQESGYASDLFSVTLELLDVGDFSLYYGRDIFSDYESKFVGVNEPLNWRVRVSEIPTYDDEESKNFAAKPTKDIMDELSRVFGYEKTRAGVWDESGYLYFVKGSENQR